MCCGSFGYPDPGGYVIAGLEKGDEITLQPGLGKPSSSEVRALIVCKVVKFSALCMDGTMLMCTDGDGVAKTGRKIKAKPNTKARLILFRVWLREVAGWFDNQTENIKTKIWLIKFRLCNRNKRTA